MTARRTPPSNRRTIAGAKRTSASSRKLTGSIAMLVRSDGETTLGLSITSGGWDEQGDATVPVAVGNRSVSTQLAGEVRR